LELEQLDFSCAVITQIGILSIIEGGKGHSHSGKEMKQLSASGY
jgi:hypothetical protein